MANQMTELVFIIDRSGSMSGKEKATIQGFNGILDDYNSLNRKAFQNRGCQTSKLDISEEPNWNHHTGNKVLVTTVLFDHEYDMLHYRRPIQHIKPMTKADYVPRGCTALYDAIGQTIHHIVNGHRHDNDAERPSKVLFVIMTDGMENASHHYSSEAVKRMIRTETEKYHWEFMFLGANINAAESAEEIGIAASCAAQFDANCDEDVECCMDGMRNLVMRCCEAPQMSLSEQMDDDWRGKLRRNCNK